MVSFICILHAVTVPPWDAGCYCGKWSWICKRKVQIFLVLVEIQLEQYVNVVAVILIDVDVKGIHSLS